MDKQTTTEMNRKYLKGVLKENATWEERQQNLHEYLTDPRRGDDKVTCYCGNCQPDGPRRKEG